MRLDMLSDLPAIRVLGHGVTEPTRLRLVVEFKRPTAHRDHVGDDVRIRFRLSSMRRRRSRYWISSYSTAAPTSSDHTDPHNSPYRVRHHQPDTLVPEARKSPVLNRLNPNDPVVVHGWAAPIHSCRYRSSEVRVDVTGAEFDVVVVGGGVGGVAAVRKLASAGLAVALVEDRLVAGDCHYFACNPSRTLLRSIEVFNLAKAVPGVREAISGEGLDVPAVFAKRDAIIEHLSDQDRVASLRQAGVAVFHGFGRLSGELNSARFACP